MTRFGMEEEFQLLDETTLVPVPLDSAAGAALPSGAGAVTKEFLTSQIEFATSPVATIAQAGEQLRSFRRALSAFAQQHGGVVIGAGTPFGTGPAASVSPSERYDALARWLGHIVDGHHVTGLHVHVEVPDDEARVRALNAVRPWMPVLLALSANSPYADGHDTGHHSWRSIIMRRFPLAGCPPHFPDMDAYRTAIAHLVTQRVIPDVASVSWALRISDSYPTVELRLFDAQLTVDDALLLAALSRALVASAPVDTRPQDADTVQFSMWAAGREGLDATVVRPDTGEFIRARDAVELLLQSLAPVLDESGDLLFVREHLARILRTGTGAERQRAAFAADGIDGLRALGCDTEAAGSALS